MLLKLFFGTEYELHTIKGVLHINILYLNILQIKYGKYLSLKQ